MRHQRTTPSPALLPQVYRHQSRVVTANRLVHTAVTAFYKAVTRTGPRLPEMRSPPPPNKPEQVNGAEATAPLSPGFSARAFSLRRKELSMVSDWEKRQGSGWMGRTGLGPERRLDLWEAGGGRRRRCGGSRSRKVWRRIPHPLLTQLCASTCRSFSLP